METLVKILNTPILLSGAIFLIPLWFLFDYFLKGKLTNRDIVFNLLSGAIFIFLAYIEKLTMGVGLILVIPLSILSDYLEKTVFFENFLGRGENEKRFTCPRPGCGKKSQVGMYSRETHEFICPECADKEKEIYEEG